MNTYSQLTYPALTLQIPNVEGKAGMMGIHDPSGDLDLSSLAAGLNSRLPSYARPLFLRVLRKGLDLTGTFKHKKFRLQTEGFDPEEVGDQDKLYFMDPSKGEFQPLDRELYQDITQGRIRL